MSDADKPTETKPAEEETPAPAEAAPTEGAPAEAPAAEADKAEADKAEADKAEADKAEAEKAEAEKAEAEKAEADKAEADKAAAEQAEAEKVVAEEVAATEAEKPAAPSAPAEDAPSAEAYVDHAQMTAPDLPADLQGVQTQVMGDKSAPPPSRLFFVDFTPCVVSAGNGNPKSLCHPTFEGFKSLFNRANQWIQNNAGYCVLNVEQIYKPVDWSGELKPGQTHYNTKEVASGNYVRGIRVWVVPRDPNDTTPADSLAYFIQKPVGAAAREPEDIMDIQTTVETLNANLRDNPLPGRIVSMDTLVTMVDEDWQVSRLLSPDFGEDTYFPAPKGKVRCVTVLRIIYAQGPPVGEEVGIADFAPAITKVPSAGKGRTFFQALKEVRAASNQWIAANDGKTLRVTNIQYANARVTDVTPKMAKLKKDGKGFDTKSMWFEGSTHFETSILKFVRVFYVKLNMPEEREPICLTDKAFIPYRKNVRTPDTVGISDTVGLANAWLSFTENKVMGVQTAIFELNQTANTVDLEEACIVQDTKLKYFIEVVVLHLHGSYVEPQKKLLPFVQKPISAHDGTLKVAEKPKSSTCTVL